MSVDIDALRADYRKVRAWWSTQDCWGPDEINEADAAIAQAVKQNDQPLLICWENYFREIIQQIPANQIANAQGERK
jgi:hypothetical protein